MASLRATPIVALDFGNARDALAMVSELGEQCSFYKIGSELFTVEGPSVVQRVRERGARVFLDLKFHDIPNTVRGACRSAGALGASLLTVHAGGGPEMLEAAVAGARDAEQRSGAACGVLAVTILTSLSGDELGAVWHRPIGSIEDEVLRLAGMAATSGVHGVVCSGLEVAAVRARHGDGLAALVPGVRLPGSGSQDQVRVVTPRDAADRGARYVVLGRTVTAAKSPRDAMRAVLADLS